MGRAKHTAATSCSARRIFLRHNELHGYIDELHEVVNIFPAGHAGGTNVLRATWGFKTGTTNPWMRLTTSSRRRIFPIPPSTSVKPCVSIFIPTKPESGVRCSRNGNDSGNWRRTAEPLVALNGSALAKLERHQIRPHRQCQHLDDAGI